MTFLKNDPRPCATLKQVFLDRFELVVAHLGPPKMPKCLENGLLWDQKLGGTNLTYRVVGAPKNGQKVSLLALVANSETHRKNQFPKTRVWGSYFILFHCQQ